MVHISCLGVPSFSAFAFPQRPCQGWEAAVSPLGGLQSAAHRRWCEACWTQNLIGRTGNPPYNPSQEAGDHRRHGPKKRKSLHFSIFWPTFSPSEIHFEKCFEKSSKKMRKSRFLGSQNLPKTLPKSNKNRGSKKLPFFLIFGSIFNAF